MHKTLLFALLFSVGILPVGNPYAADVQSAAGGEAVDADKECQRVKNLQPPRENYPSKALLDSVAGCDAETLYYNAKNKGGATSADWEKVRACAISTNKSAFLMMLYANGYGVKQNLDLAIKYACGGNGMFVEPAKLVAELEDVRSASGYMSKPFDICDYAEGTPAINRCSGVKEMETLSKREQRLVEISRQMTPAQKASFEQLSHAAGGFSSGRGDEVEESVGTGSGRVAFGASSRMEEDDRFLDDIGQAEKGQLPAYTQEQFAELDQQLNEVYKRIMHSGAKDEHQPGVDAAAMMTVIKAAQKDWLKYRDAWVAFGKLRYPAVPAHAWKAMLTERRIKQLGELADVLD